MGLFTTLSEAGAAALATAFGLGTVTTITPIAAGTVNSNFALQTATGPVFVRINEGKAEVEVAFEVAVLEAVAGGGVPTPLPLRGRDGRRYTALDGKWVSVYPWVAGVHRTTSSAADAHALGAALAQLHQVALPPGLALAPSRYDDAELARRRARIAAAADAALTPALAQLTAEAAWLETQAPVRAAASHGLIHGDLFRDNVLWADGTAAEVVALLDFEQASAGSRPYDLAVCLNDWCWDEAAARPRADLARALVTGYQSVRPLGATDRRALPVELRAAAARFTTTRITDVYLRRIDSPGKDFRAYLARLDAWQAGALGDLVAPV